jgi:hypothetical protein
MGIQLFVGLDLPPAFKGTFSLLSLGIFPTLPQETQSLRKRDPSGGFFFLCLVPSSPKEMDSSGSLLLHQRKPSLPFDNFKEINYID